MPKVSVITPTYNRKNIVGKSIESVINQTFKDWELIIVDDGSTDNTEEVVKEYAAKNKNIRYFKQENRGASSARNLGIKKSEGELIAFLDSDNDWFPNFLEVMVGVLQESPRSLLAYSSQNLLLLSPNKEGKMEIISRKVRSVEYSPVKLTRTNYIDPSSVVVRKKVLDEIGYFDEEIEHFEDWDLWVRIAIKHPFGILQIDQVLGNYYYREEFDAQTNQVLSKNAIRTYMGKPSSDLATKRVLAKIEEYLQESSKLTS